jgi:hypothetical protein
MTVTVQLPQELIDDVKRRRGLMNLTGDVTSEIMGAVSRRLG